MQGVFLCVFVALCVVSCYGATSYKAELVELFNQVRAEAPAAKPLNSLTWDDSLAAVAQGWADKCKKTHSRSFTSTLLGEIVYISDSDVQLDNIYNDLTAQGNSFDFSTASCKADSCGFWTQVVGAKVTSFGCGVSTCSFGTVLVCNFAQYGQYTGILPFVAAAAPSVGAYTSTTAKSTSTTAKTTTGTTGAATTGSSSGSVDYRGTAKVTTVKNQGQCGSCWAFAATAVVEGALGLKYGTVQSLSEEQILDCTSGSCNGGWPATALSETIKNQGGLVDLLTPYPYTGTKATCAYNAANSGGGIGSYGNTAKDQASILAGLNKYGPLAVAVNADNAWQSYKTGVLSQSGTTTVNHAVTLVGYDATKNAWIIKNSWGTTWGMSGFVYVDAANPYGMQLNGGTWAVAK